MRSLRQPKDYSYSKALCSAAICCCWKWFKSFDFRKKKFMFSFLGYQPRGGLFYYKGSHTYENNNNNKMEPVQRSKEILNLIGYLLIIFPIIYPVIAPAFQLQQENKLQSIQRFSETFDAQGAPDALGLLPDSLGFHPIQKPETCSSSTYSVCSRFGCIYYNQVLLPQRGIKDKQTITPEQQQE